MTTKKQIDNLVQAFKNLKEQEAVEFFAELEAAIKKSNSALAAVDKFVSTANLSFKALKISQAVIGDLGQQFVNFNEQLVESSTNFSKDYRDSITKTRDELMRLSSTTSDFGVGFRENLQITKEFSKENVKLLPIYRKNISGLVDFSARLKAFKVDTSLSAQVVGTLTSNLDMTSDQLDLTRRSLVSFANQTGQSVQEVVRSYSTSIKSFMDFLDPREMNRNFMQFQVMARRMGMEANSLYDIATKFDTIEGAQQIGQRLNQTFSAVGIEFNALALQELEPRQRIDYIASKTREALKRARTMGGREGRLLIRSLQGAGLGDLATIRAFGAEGGMGRAGAFELGGGLARPMTRDQEALTAQRLNVANLERARAEQRELLILQETKTFRRALSLIDNFAENIIEYDDKLGPLKEAKIRDVLTKLDDRTDAAVNALMLAAKGQTKINDELKAILKAASFTDEQIKNLKNVADAVDALAKIGKSAGPKGNGLRPTRPDYQQLGSRIGNIVAKEMENFLGV